MVKNLKQRLLNISLSVKITGIVGLMLVSLVVGIIWYLTNNFSQQVNRSVMEYMSVTADQYSGVVADEFDDLMVTVENIRDTVIASKKDIG